MARDRQRQLEAAGRIRELRGIRPQPVIADAIGVRLRTYQHWEEGDGIAWENLQKLASYHDVSENYILYGEDKPVGPESPVELRLARVEAQLDELLSRLPAAEIRRLQAEEIRRGAAPGASTPASPRKPRQQGKAR